MGPEEVLIGKDGFRADPDTGKGNPERCQFALVGDSMIYGSGLPYLHTLGPVLHGLGLDACVFGVTGNSTADYLATLRFVANKINPEAHVAVCLSVYNDFVGLNKYFRRGFLSLYNSFPRVFEWALYFDNWRQTTFTYNLFRSEKVRPPVRLWEYDVRKTESIKLLYPYDPAAYKSPQPLNWRQLVALDLFFEGLDELARRHSWRVYIVIHPDFPEIFANLARGSSNFIDLDPRRADGLKACKEFSFVCEDISRYFYERSVSESMSPYFIDNRHFSAFGTRILAEHFATLTKGLRDPSVR
jgi:hypothetical protein